MQFRKDGPLPIKHLEAPMQPAARAAADPFVLRTPLLTLSIFAGPVESYAGHALPKVALEK